MRHSPSFEIELRHFGVWRTGGAVAALGAAAGLGAWFWQSHGGLLAAVGASVGAAMIAAAVALVRRDDPVLLRCDGRVWSATRAPGGSAVASAGQLDVVIDLGVWMLLRLRPGSGPGTGRTTWIPAQRRGHEAHWHALRCAVYSPRPTVGGPSGAEPDPPE
jgi:hypothetical protein